MFSCPYAFRLTHCERRRRWAGRDPDFVLRIMPAPLWGAQLGPKTIITFFYDQAARAFDPSGMVFLINSL